MHGRTWCIVRNTLLSQQASAEGSRSWQTCGAVPLCRRSLRQPEGEHDSPAAFKWCMNVGKGWYFFFFFCKKNPGILFPRTPPPPRMISADLRMIRSVRDGFPLEFVSFTAYLSLYISFLRSFPVKHDIIYFFTPQLFPWWANMSTMI